VRLETACSSAFLGRVLPSFCSTSSPFPARIADRGRRFDARRGQYRRLSRPPPRPAPRRPASPLPSTKPACSAAPDTSSTPGSPASCANEPTGSPRANNSYGPAVCKASTRPRHSSACVRTPSSVSTVTAASPVSWSTLPPWLGSSQGLTAGGQLLADRGQFQVPSTCGASTTPESVIATGTARLVEEDAPERAGDRG
jgi:hypothetical protein